MRIDFLRILRSETMRLIDADALINRIVFHSDLPFDQKEVFEDEINAEPPAEPENCEGCKHFGKWENEVEYGYPSPCTRCKRRVEDHYER